MKSRKCKNMMKFFILQKQIRNISQLKRKGLSIMASMILKAITELSRAIRLDIGLKLVSLLEKVLLDRSLNVETTKRKRMLQSKW